MNKVPPRIVIYAQDVMNITGRKRRCAYKLLEKIRERYQKPREAFVGIDEFCEYTGLREERVIPFLN